MCAPTDTHTTAGFDHGRRGAFNAWFFTAFDRYGNHIQRRHKEFAFAGLSPGVVVELGAGVGGNLDHLAPGSSLIAVEPNLAMHDGLRRRAAERGIGVEIITAGAESIPLPDASVDEVICSLVLCTVEDQQMVLDEVRRILRPGGRFRFVEHVAAPRWSPRRWMQHVLRRPWSWIYEGCDLCRDTGQAVEMAGFAQLEIRRRRLRHSAFVPVNTAIAGIAHR